MYPGLPTLLCHTPPPPLPPLSPATSIVLTLFPHILHTSLQPALRISTPLPTCIQHINHVAAEPNTRLTTHPSPIQRNLVDSASRSPKDVRRNDWTRATINTAIQNDKAVQEMFQKANDGASPLTGGCVALPAGLPTLSQNIAVPHATITSHTQPQPTYARHITNLCQTLSSTYTSIYTHVLGATTPQAPPSISHACTALLRYMTHTWLCMTLTPDATSRRAEWVLRKLNVKFDRNTMTHDQGYAEVEKHTDIPVYLILDLHFLYNIPFATIIGFSRRDAAKLSYELRDVAGGGNGIDTVHAPLGSAARPICVDSSDDDELPEEEVPVVADLRQTADSLQPSEKPAGKSGKGGRKGNGSNGVAA